jgi:glycosyltransferase involved in cell wall biosynthesis
VSTPESSAARPVAYLMNRYPQGNQSFIWREIAALESMGVKVERFSVRRWTERLVDPTAIAERDKTRVLLDGGIFGLLAGAIASLLSRPVSFFRALSICFQLGWRSERGLLFHLVYLAEACVLLRWVKVAGACHVHAHMGTNSAMVALLCRALGGPPYSFTCHGPTEFDRPVYIALGEKIRRSAFVVAVGEYGRSQLFRWCGHEQWNKIHVIRCGVDNAFLADDQVTAPPADARLVCVGRLVEQKGHLLLVEAAAQLAAQGIKFEIVIIGDGPMRKTLERLIGERGVEDSVRLAGWMSNDEVREEIRRSRAMVLPSFAEGLPVVLMEALAMGRPVVASSIAAVPELVENRVSGWLVPPGSVDALAAAMRDVLTADPAVLEQMGRAGRERVLANHNVTREVAKLAALFAASAETYARS